MEKETAVLANLDFENEILAFLRHWARSDDESYLASGALRDFFLLATDPLQTLLSRELIYNHLSRPVDASYFDPETGDPLLAASEQRIYNLLRRVSDERLHIPFRSVQPNKQTDAGDIADITTYPVPSDTLRYNSGNHFSSRPANLNVFEENSANATFKSANNLFILFRRGFLEERLQDVKAITAAMHEAGETQPQFFVICSRHSAKEGHFGASLVVMDPTNPDFPKRVLICDTLLKELPHHPRWWNHFVAAYSHLFGDGVIELLEDLSHPLQKVNITGDEPYRHDWDCPYYVASMTHALADMVKLHFSIVLNGRTSEIYEAMKTFMPDYYETGGFIKSRSGIKLANRHKRWNSGRTLIQQILTNPDKEPSKILSQK